MTKGASRSRRCLRRGEDVMKGGEEKRDGDWGGGSSSKRGDEAGWSEARMRQRQAQTW